MARKRKTLPNDFAETLETASCEELTAVFDRCEIDARGGSNKATAIGHVNCPDELIVWLVDQGLSPDEPDSYGVAPIMARATTRWRSRVDQIPLLLSLGASAANLDECMLRAASRFNVGAVKVLIDCGVSADPIDGTNSPLSAALRSAENANITDLADIARLLLAHGAQITPKMREHVQRIGERFEHYRDVFAADSIEQTDAALQALYDIFDVAPAPRRVPYDGVSPIRVGDGEWFAQHEELWKLLVPGTGTATTTQGEAIRLSGKIAREILDNGSINWGQNFGIILQALPEYYSQGNPLPEGALADAHAIARDGKRGALSQDQVYRLEQLAVEWVQRNPDPIPLPQPSYAH